MSKNKKRKPKLLPKPKVGLRYESNRKHSEPWQPGRKGSLCDAAVKPHASKLLKESEKEGDKRYAIFEGRAYCAQEHTPGAWHGYPIGWLEVPNSLVNKWKREGKVTRRDLKKFRETHE